MLWKPHAVERDRQGLESPDRHLAGVVPWILKMEAEEPPISLALMEANWEELEVLGPVGRLL